jgi:hypothetical protein
MKIGLFLLVLYGIDFATDPAFGCSAWTQEWGNTLSISQPSDPSGHPRLDSPRVFEPCQQSHTQPLMLYSQSPHSHSGADLVYSFLTIRC